MRDSLSEIEKIEQYLLEKLNEEERKEIEMKIEKDKTFAQKVELQRKVIERLVVLSRKQEIQKAHKRNVNAAKPIGSSTKKIVFVLMTIVVIITSIVVFISQNEEVVTEDTSIQEKIVIRPPLKGVDVPFTNKYINPLKDNVLLYASGSVLIIPSNAFVDSDGLNIKDSIQIQFREFSDVVDLYLSGIPMDYEIEGKKYPFESAAMCEIYAFSNGVKVKLKAGKKIEVVQSTYSTSSVFNLYQFDKENGSWVNKGKDVGMKLDFQNEPHAIAELTSDTMKEDSLLEQLTEEEPLKPQKANPEALRFSINYEENEFPELKSFDNVLFEIDSELSNFEEGDNEIEWEDVQIERGESSGRYKVAFSKESENIRREYFVRPVFEGKNFDKAMVLYNKKMNSYVAMRQKSKQERTNRDRIQRAKELALKRRNRYIDSINLAIEQRNVIIEERNLQIEKQNAMVITANKRLLARMDSLYRLREERRKINKDQIDSIQKDTRATEVLKRIYSIDDFGIWNSDCPVNLPKGAILAAEFNFKNQAIKTVVLIDKNRRGLFNYYSNMHKEFQYNPLSENIVWAVVNQKVVYFNRFDDLPDNDFAPFVFEMEELDIPVGNYASIKHVMMKL